MHGGIVIPNRKWFNDSGVVLPLGCSRSWIKEVLKWKEVQIDDTKGEDSGVYRYGAETTDEVYCKTWETTMLKDKNMTKSG